MSTDPEGWEERTLGSCALYINGYAFKPEDWHEFGTPIIRIEQLHDANAHYDSCPRDLPDRFVINNDVLIFSWSATLSLKIWDRGKAFLNQHLYKVIAKNGVDKIFLKYLIEFNLDRLAGETHGSTMKHITRPHLLEYHVALPKSILEQKKIASILQNVDNAIDKTKELIEKYKKMKQGLTQSLFDAKRLIGTERRLSECCIFIRDGTHGSYEDSEDGIPLLSAKDVVYGKITKDNNPRRISLRDYYSIHSKYELREGDVVLTIVGTIGRSAVLRKLTEKFTFQRSVAILRPKKEVNSSYLYHYTNTSKFQKNLEMAVNASAQGGVYLGALNKMPIVIPDEPKSQAEIVSILDSIDENIDIEQSYLDKLAKIKSGLMQDLLTGKVRVDA